MLGESEMTDRRPMAVAPGSGESANTVLGKVFGILNCFSDGDRTLTLTDLAHQSGLPKSTVHRLAGTLVEHGMLERVYGEFRLGLRLFELGSLVPRWQIVRDAAIPFMEDLCAATHGTIHLGILDVPYVVYLDKIHGRAAPQIASRCGGRILAHCTAVGKALLAFAPRDMQEEILGQPLASRTRYSITSASVLRDQLDEAVDRGFAIEREEAALGVQCVAAAVLSPRRQSIAALSVTTSNADGDVERFAPAVRTAVSDLSRELAPWAYVI
jgi:IclR family acetate operon transcriptional repressor